MEISVTDAMAQLTDLVQRAEAGDDIVLTNDGKAAVRLVPVKPVFNATARLRRMEQLSAVAKAKATPGPSAARSQDFLYGEDGLPA